MKFIPTLLRLLFVGLVLGPVTPRAGAQVPKGASRAEVIQILGWPTSKSTSENREILTYPECNVLLEEGKVVKLEFKSRESRGQLWNRLDKASRVSTSVPRPAQVSPILPPTVPVQTFTPTPYPQRTAMPQPRPPPPRDDSWPQFGRNMALLTLSFFAAGAILIYWNRDRIRSAALRDKMLKKRTDPAQANSLNAETPIQPERKPDPLLDGWSLGLLRDLDWRRFEEVVAEYERLLGNQPRLGAIGPDGGIDLRIIDATSGQVSRLVQCKAHSSLVKVDAVRAFYGVMHSEKVDRGTFYATDGFPNVAKDFVAGKNLELIDGETLIARIRQLELPVQIRLFNFAIEGDYKSATCARCTKKMVLATNRNNRRHWRCRCGNTLWARAE